MDDEELRRMVRRHHTAIRQLGEMVQAAAELEQANADAVGELNAGYASMLGIIEAVLNFVDRADRRLDAERAELHKLQEQFAAMQEMFAMRHAKRMSPPPLSVIEGGGGES